MWTKVKVVWCKYPIVFNYEIFGNPIERLYEIRDLGVVSDRTLSLRAMLT